jgi:hypothetical protein
VEPHLDSLLCDAATVRDGLLHVLGAGITRITRPAFPAKMGVELALLLTFENAAAAEGDHRLVVRVEGAGQEVGRVEIAFGARSAEEIPEQDRNRQALAPLVVPLREVALPEPGDYTIVVALDEKPLSRNEFVAVGSQEKLATQAEDQPGRRQSGDYL